MSRRYFEPVQVRFAADDPSAPGQFVWRGRLYRVRTVLAHWVEGGSWWRRPQRSGERQVWRVEAGTGRSALAGVYDLCRVAAEFHAATDTAQTQYQWHLVRTFD